MISQINYKAIFDVSPSAKLLVEATPSFYKILDANNAYLEATHSRREEIIGKGIFEAFPPNPTDLLSKERTSFSLEQAIITKKTHLLKEYRYDVPGNNPDEYLECYWTTTNTPVLDQTGDILYIIHSPENVTAEVKLKQDLVVAEERTRLAVESNDLGTFDIDLTTGESVTSKRFNEIFGLTQNANRANIISMIHPADLLIRDKAYQEAYKTGRLFYEVRIIRPDKMIRWIRAEGKIFYNDDRKPYRIIGLLQDCTNEHHAKEQEQKLITLVDNSVDLMSILQLDGVNSYLNQAGMEMLGFDSPEQVKAIPISSLHTPEDFRLVEEEVLPTVMAKGKWSGTMNVRNLKTNEIFPVLNNAIRIDDPVLKIPIAIGAVMRDLRPEIAARLAVQKSENLLKIITGASPTALWKTNALGEVDYVNQTWLDWTGNTIEQNIKDWEQFIVEEDREKTLQTFTESLKNRSDYQAEYRIMNADGSHRWILANGRPLQNEQGEFLGLVGACIDVSALKRLQAQKDDFLAIASHELKTPLTTIKAYIQLIQQMLLQKNIDAEASFANKVDKQVNKLVGLVNDLLDVTKISTGKMQFNNTVFDIAALVNQVSDDLQYITTTHRIIKKLDTSAKVLADKERIEQVVINLLTNAVKYSPDATEVFIESTVTGHEFHLHVKDFGIGIPEQDWDKVFEQFYRVEHFGGPHFQGLGLGLYISAEIIKRQNGRIWVNSSKENGTIFSIELPLYIEAE